MAKKGGIRNRTNSYDQPSQYSAGGTDVQQAGSQPIETVEPPTLKDRLAGAWDNTKEVVQKAADVTKKGITETWEQTKEGFHNAKESGNVGFSKNKGDMDNKGNMEGMEGMDAKEPMSTEPSESMNNDPSFKDKLSDGTKKVWDNTKEVVQKAADVTKKGLTSTWEQTKEGIQNAKERMRGEKGDDKMMNEHPSSMPMPADATNDNAMANNTVLDPEVKQFYKDNNYVVENDFIPKDSMAEKSQDWVVLDKENMQGGNQHSTMPSQGITKMTDLHSGGGGMTEKRSFESSPVESPVPEKYQRTVL